MFSRDLSLAEVSPQNSRTAAITPAWLALCGRELARAGQFVCDIAVISGAVALQPAAFSLRGTGKRGPVNVDLDSEYVRSWVTPALAPDRTRGL